MIVVDASAVLELLLRTSVAGEIEERLFAPRETLHAPYLLDIEVTQTLRRFAASAAISASRGREAIADLADLPVNRYPHSLLLDRVWALRNNFSAYDAAYVALAEILAARLLTRDRRLARAAARLIEVDVI